MTESPVLLEVRDLHAGYGDLEVLRGLSLEVGAGEFVALARGWLGRPGSGLLPIRAGVVRLGGEVINGRPPYEIAARGLAMIPEGRRLFGPLSVRENLELGAFLPWARARRDETLRTIFTLFPVLADKQEAPAHVLSGGEQQMLALARGLMACPRLLCLDDPFLGLQRSVTDRFCQAVHAITAGGLTILAAGQHVRRLLTLATRGYLLDEGRVVVAGPGRELLADERLKRTLLELHPEGR